MTPANPESRRYKSWTARLDENGLPGKMGYFTGTEWAELEAGARTAGYVTLKKVKGQQTEVSDVTGYIMHLHRARQGASSE